MADSSVVTGTGMLAVRKDGAAIIGAKGDLEVRGGCGKVKPTSVEPIAPARRRMP